MNESDQQNQLLSALASALYNKIIDKCDKIDFGSIPRSRGDITKIDGYNNTVECINIIRRLVVEYKEDTSIIDVELTALNNVKALRPLFIKAFNNNSSFGMMYYNLITLSIQHSVSFLISVAIQYTKSPDNKNIHMALDKAAYRDSESNMIFEQLVKFNKSYANGDVEKVLRSTLGAISETAESDEYFEDTITLTSDVDDAIENAPESEDTPLDEDSELLMYAAGTNNYDNKVSSSSDDDELAAGANNPDTKDDEVIPTPTIPINGSAVGEAVEPKKIIDTILSHLPGGKTKAGRVIYAGTTILILLIKVIIPTIRRIVYYYYALRADISESLAIQADLIELNALELQADENSNLTDEKKAKVVERQLKIAQKLRALAEKFALKDKKAKKDAQKDIDDDKKKNKSSDLKDNLPDDVANDSDLF